MSHETIYRSLFIQARGVLKKELLQHSARTRGCVGAAIHATDCTTRGQIVGAVSIRDGPRPNRGPRSARPLGRRPDVRCPEQPHRNAGRAPLAVVMLVRVGGKTPRWSSTRSIGRSPNLPQELYKPHSRGIVEPRLACHRAIHAWHRHPRSTSAIHAVLGNAAVTRTRTVCSGSTCPRASTSRATPQAKLNAIARQLTRGQGRHLATKRRLRCSATPLHRPVESAGQSSSLRMRRLLAALSLSSRGPNAIRSGSCKRRKADLWSC